nr:sugar transporter ERD6-like 5 [Ipomoea batatas]
MLASILQLLGLFFIPESPRWLAKSGRWKECEASLKLLRGENANISEEASEIRGYTETLQQLSESNLIDLFQRKYAHSLIVRPSNRVQACMLYHVYFRFSSDDS